MKLPFQSTLPLRGATFSIVITSKIEHISIHAPLTGSDILILINKFKTYNFNPRSPYGERQEPFRDAPL